MFIYEEILRDILGMSDSVPVSVSGETRESKKTHPSISLTTRHHLPLDSRAIHRSFVIHGKFDTENQTIMSPESRSFL